MKKAYSKPEIIFENFSLSTNIAGDCEVKTWLPSNNSCGMEFTGIDGNVFLTDMNGCSFQVGEGGDGEFGNICYHVPYGDNLFNS